MLLSRVPFRRLVLAIACLGLLATNPAGAADFTVSILPLEGLVAELAGVDAVDVLVGAGATPALYEPTARQMARLSRSRVLFVVGVPFELTFLPRVRQQLPDLRVVDVAAGIERLELPHVSGHDGHEHASDLDPHVWTDPRLVLRMIDTIADALIEMDPAQRDRIDARRRDLRERWTALDTELESALGDVSTRTIAVFHPAFGYFAARYGFEQLAVESGGTDTGPRHLVELAGRLREHAVRTLFVQPQFSPQRARTIANTLDVEVVEIDPLSRDVPGMLRELARALGGRMDAGTR